MSGFNNDREPTSAEIDRVVGQALRVRRRVKEQSGPHAVADCVWCGKEGKLYVNADSGMWDCKVCEESGNLWKLATRVGIRVREESAIVRAAGRIMKQALKAKTPKAPVRDVAGIDLAAVTTASERLFKVDDDKGARVLAYLHERGIDDETIRRFKLGVTWIRDGGDVQPELAVGIPYVVGDRVPLVKMRNLEHDKERRKFRRTKGGYSGMFNADGIKGCEQVVLVEGELDAISLWQLGVHNVASTSLGAKKTIPDDWLELLEDVDDLVLWYDDDDKGQEAATALMEQLGTYRCRLAFMPKIAGVVAKDANDVLKKLPAEQARQVVREAIDGAKGVENALVVRPTAYIEHVEAEWAGGTETAIGVPTGWPCIDRMLAGIRLGELTLVTGHTAHGKTTWSNQLLLNLARAGHPSMSSALENGPQMVARKFYQTEAGAPLSSLKTEEQRRDALANIRKLDAIPLYILDLYGRQLIAPIVDAITYARRRFGVRYVLIDHLNFIGKENPRQDRVEHLDETLQVFTELTRRLGIHLFLIAHPRGEVPDDVVPGGGQVKGTSSAKQNTDNGVTVFRAVDSFGNATKKAMKIKDPMGRKIEIDLKPRDVLVQVWKARHDDAREGSTVLDFDRGTLVYKSTDASNTEAGASQGDANETRQGDLLDQAGEDPFDWGGGAAN